MAMELAVGGGAVGGSGGDDHHEPSDPNRDKKRYHRHTAEQIQLLEATFKECPHPDEKMRLQLSRELGLNPRQIKFWFQNRRTQLKAKSEMADNCLLRVENDKIRSENIAIKEALKNAMCITCGGPPVPQDQLLEEQRLRFENAHLKEELDRISSIAAKFIGRPLSLFAPPPIPPAHLSTLDLSMASYVGGTQHQMIPMDSGSAAAGGGPSLDLDLFTTTGMAAQPPTIHPSHPFRPADKSIVADIATSAMAELLRLFQSDEPFWTKSAADGRDVLEIDTYDRIFPRPNMSIKNPNLWIEASRGSGDVMMHSLQLVDMFSDSTKWADLFPTIVSKARTIEMISSGLFGNQSGSLQLMYEELQVASPLVPIRQFLFVRYIQQIEPETWAVVDVSYDPPQDDGFPNSQLTSRRLPSGCLIRSMPNGYSKVMWIEHLEIEEKTTVHRLYRDLVYSGLAFGAERWVACLQRSCERIVCQMVTNSNSSVHELGGVIPSADGKKIVMNLAQRMVNNFCASIGPGHLGTSVSDFDDFEVHTSLFKSPDPSQANTAVLAAATTVWMPFSPQFIFDFLRDESNRHLWDVLTNHHQVQEVTRIANGAHPGNCISLLQTRNTSQTNILILQESCTDSSGSMVVYCPVDVPVINIAMSGEDPLYIPLLPSGFAITTDGRQSSTTPVAAGDSSSGRTPAGSLVTLMVQSVIGGPAWGKLGPESMATINNLMGNTIRQIKAGLNCSSSTTPT